MTILEMMQKAEFLVDSQGQRRAVVFDYELWQELLPLLEDLEDAEEMNRLRDNGVETVSWREAKSILRAEGLDV